MCEGVMPFNQTLNRRVVQRRSKADGATVDATWVYARQNGLVDGTYFPTVSVEAHQGGETGALLASELHYFLAVDAQYKVCTTHSNGTGNDKWQNAKEFRTERQTGAGAEIIQRNWEQRAPVVWGNDPGLSSRWENCGGATGTSPRNLLSP